MPNIKSAKKRVLVNKTKNERNRAAKTAMKTQLKKFKKKLKKQKRKKRILIKFGTMFQIINL